MRGNFILWPIVPFIHIHIRIKTPSRVVEWLIVESSCAIWAPNFHHLLSGLRAKVSSPMCGRFPPFFQESNLVMSVSRCSVLCHESVSFKGARVGTTHSKSQLYEPFGYLLTYPEGCMLPCLPVGLVERLVSARHQREPSSMYFQLPFSQGCILGHSSETTYTTIMLLFERNHVSAFATWALALAEDLVTFEGGEKQWC